MANGFDLKVVIVKLFDCFNQRLKKPSDFDYKRLFWSAKRAFFLSLLKLATDFDLQTQGFLSFIILS